MKDQTVASAGGENQYFVKIVADVLLGITCWMVYANYLGISDLRADDEMIGLVEQVVYEELKEEVASNLLSKYGYSVEATDTGLYAKKTLSASGVLNVFRVYSQVQIRYSDGLPVSFRASRGGYAL